MKTVAVAIVATLVITAVFSAYRDKGLPATVWALEESGGLILELIEWWPDVICAGSTYNASFSVTNPNGTQIETVFNLTIEPDVGMGEWHVGMWLNEFLLDVLEVDGTFRSENVFIEPYSYNVLVVEVTSVPNVYPGDYTFTLTAERVKQPRLWIWKHGAKVYPEWQVGYISDTQVLYARIVNTGEHSAYVKVEFIIYDPAGLESVESNILLCDGIPPGNVTISAEYHPTLPGTFYFQAILYFSYDTIEWRPWSEVQDILGGEGVSKTASSKFKVR